MAKFGMKANWRQRGVWRELGRRRGRDGDIGMKVDTAIERFLMLVLLGDNRFRFLLCSNWSCLLMVSGDAIQIRSRSTEYFYCVMMTYSALMTSSVF